MKTLQALLSSEGFIFSRASNEIYLIASPIPGIMREYFPRVWKPIQAVLLEILLNQPNQLFFVFAFLLTSDDPFNKAGKC